MTTNVSNSNLIKRLMNSENINEKITLNITMNVVLITAISVLINTDYFTDGTIIHQIINTYGLSLIFLILFYVGFELWGEYLIEKEIGYLKNRLLVNLVIASISLFLLMQANIFVDFIDGKAIDSSILILMASNGIIPFFLIEKVLLARKRKMHMAKR